MPDKKSIAEALKMIRRNKRMVKKSLGGIGRTFYFGGEPAKAIVSSNNPEQK